ncbi:MAG: hypothetical protein JNJ76_08485 [Candidatus Competibacter sp.]|nr:hypothetical protein [Candidatus Competibacter sp.]
MRCVMDEVFDQDNFVSVIFVAKTSGFGDTTTLASVGDFLLWYAKNKTCLKYHQLFWLKNDDSSFAKDYKLVEDSKNGLRRNMSSEEMEDALKIPGGWRRFSLTATSSQGATLAGNYAIEYRGKIFQLSGNQHWKTSADGMKRLIQSNRVHARENSLRYIRYLKDFPVVPITNNWSDLRWGFDAGEKRYVVETNPGIIARCLLMTTDPGDLVLDPTCGSGTTAYVAEQWGRRWITIDTSRVALALARQRLITAKFDYYQLRPTNEEDLRRNPNGAWLSVGSLTPRSALPSPGGRGVGGEGKFTLDCETVPHITLKSIAQNAALDPIFAKHQPILDEKRATLNAALAGCEGLRTKLAAKLAIKEKTEGKKAITEADRRRWLLPPAHRDPKIKLTVDARFAGWYEWEIPFDADPDWPKALQTALADYRAAWRAKMDEINAAIAANADNEELVDKPRVHRNVVRVSGPFTVEAVMPAEQNLHDDSPIDSVADELEGFDTVDAPKNVEAFLDRMIRLLAQDGVRFPNNKTAAFSRLSPIGEDFLHAEGEWSNDGGPSRQVAVTVGPEFGPVTAWQVENALTQAHRRRVYEDLVIAGFSFDAAAQALVQDDPNPQVRCHLAHIRPDVNMGGLLKDTPNAQLFTVFGSPRTRLDQTPDGLFTVTLEGVDIYNPVDNTILATQVDKVAAWFVDSDYDGRAFCITQAFFPDKSAWDKLARALKTVVDESAFAALSGTVSLPFAAGSNRRVAVKVIDPRGNEVMRVHRLDEPTRY